MNNKEFYDRMLVKYELKNSFDLEDFKRFIDENYHSEDFQPIYDLITFNYVYKSFPSIKFAKDLMEETGAGNLRSETKYDDIMRHNRTIEDGWKTWNIKAIVDRLIIINNKLDWTPRDQYFWGMFGEMFYELDHMKEKEYNKEGMAQHLGGCLDAVRKNQGFQSIIDKERYVPENVFDENEMKKDLNKPRDSRGGI